MPSKIFRVTQTGVSTTAGYTDVFFPDLCIAPFTLGVATVVTSTAMTYSVQHSWDYLGMSSTWVSTAATWFTTIGFSSVAGVNAEGGVTTPITALRLNVTTGTTAASTASVTLTVVQAG